MTSTVFIFVGAAAFVPASCVAMASGRMAGLAALMSSALTGATGTGASPGLISAAGNVVPNASASRQEWMKGMVVGWRNCMSDCLSLSFLGN
ncbi:MAG: hypothetical protein NTZ16_09405 [Verrucomicrobia bacterium]|nr:hypothetical protein [Verrucomicrobiota bacterium]